MLFSTETEYTERFNEELSDAKSRNSFQNSGIFDPLQQPVFTII